MSSKATEMQSEAIVARMNAIRNQVPYAMDDARDELKQLTDWKYYVRRFPLTAVTCTAALVFFDGPNAFSAFSNATKESVTGQI